MSEDDRDFYGDIPIPERELIGYDSYDKSEIYQGDDYVKYHGQLYHRENFVQMNLGTRGEVIDLREE